MASALLAWLEDTLTLSGIAHLRAEVREANEVARAFYRSLGFSEVGLSKGYYLGVENAVQVMRRVHCG